MPSILSESDKETVKRTVPRASNKIQAVAVARLYVAYPNRDRWTYTGLQGAAVLSNDLVGNTFWIKLVDISPANRGVIWDQEIYDTFQYNQDRTFFHSFELEHPECLAGLSFMDEKEAKTFKKKMDEREKAAHKNTKSHPFAHGVGGGAVYMQNGPAQKSHSRVGNFLRGNRHSTVNAQPQSVPAPQIGQAAYTPATSRPVSSDIDLADPTWKPVLNELMQMGFTEEQLVSQADFIKDYIRQQQTTALANGLASTLPPTGGRAPPPPPPPPAAARLSPENTGTTTSSRRGPPPAPPPSRRPVGGRGPSPPESSSPPRTPSPAPSSQPRFRAPPPLAEAGKFAVKTGVDMHSSGRVRASSGANLANPGPPPPPRPSKAPVEDEYAPTAFRVPPPFTGERKSSAPPPPPPSRGPVPPPPPSRDTSILVPPPLPPKVPDRSSAAPIPPPPPSRSNAPPLPPPNARALPPPPSSFIPPPPPPPPSSSAVPPPPPLPPFSSGPPPPPPMPPSSSGPPPPPMPSAGGPPPPPPPPPGVSGPAPPLPQPSGGHDNLLASIRGVGGAGAGGLRKVKDTEKRDRSSAAVPGGEAPPPPSGAAGATAAGGDGGAGLAGALAAALSQRKKKVAGSDDEKSDNDDW